jgi:hypothetical protein
MLTWKIPWKSNISNRVVAQLPFVQLLQLKLEVDLGSKVSPMITRQHRATSNRLTLWRYRAVAALNATIQSLPRVGAPRFKTTFCVTLFGRQMLIIFEPI